jgi:hypothetical protein
MTITMQERGDCLTGLCMGLLVNKELPGRQGQLKKIEEAIEKIASILKESQRKYDLEFVHSLKDKVNSLAPVNPIPTSAILNLVNHSRLFTERIAKQDPDAFPLVLCPLSSSQPYDDNATFTKSPSFGFVNKAKCQKLFMQVLQRRNMDEIRAWIRAIRIDLYINPDELGPEHIQLMLEANPTCGSILHHFVYERYDIAFILYINGISSEKIMYRVDELAGRRAKHNFESEHAQLVKEYNEGSIKDGSSVKTPTEILTFTPFETPEFMHMRHYQTLLRERILKRLELPSDMKDRKITKTTQDLSKLAELNKINLSVLNIISEYSLCQEEILWEVLKIRQKEILQMLKKQQESASSYRSSLDEAALNATAFGT